MKKYLLILAVIAFQNLHAQMKLSNLSLGHSSFVKYANNKFSLHKTPAFTDMEKKFTYGNLRIYMLKANNVYVQANRDLGNYTSLQEALKAKKINITEVDAGTVNTLELNNTSKDTIIILAGEIVTGGKQDRVIGQDIILKPKSGKVPVSVFCVEHGRWAAQESGQQFKGYYGLTSSSVRKQAIVSKDQSEVWDKVAVMNSKNKTSTRSGTYAALKNSDVLKTALPKYIAHFEKLMMADPDYIGFVAVTGNTVINADLFATNAMFRKQVTQLLSSAAVEAITNGSAVSVESSKVMDFLNEFLKDEVNQEHKVNANGTLLKHGSKKMHLNYYKK